MKGKTVESYSLTLEDEIHMGVVLLKHSICDEVNGYFYSDLSKMFISRKPISQYK